MFYQNRDVCLSAKIRILKQITTGVAQLHQHGKMQAKQRKGRNDKADYCLSLKKSRQYGFSLSKIRRSSSVRLCG